MGRETSREVILHPLKEYYSIELENTPYFFVAFRKINLDREISKFFCRMDIS